MKKLDPALIERMHQLRDQSMSNQMIARELGVAVRTVYRYLGNQPAMCRAEYGSVVSYATDVPNPLPAPKPATAKRVSGLHLVAQTRILDGRFYQFTVNSYGKISLRLKEPEKAANLDLKGLESYITELMDAYAELSDCIQ